jgi:hypothetical protein
MQALLWCDPKPVRSSQDETSTFQASQIAHPVRLTRCCGREGRLDLWAAVLADVTTTTGTTTTGATTTTTALPSTTLGASDTGTNSLELWIAVLVPIVATIVGALMAFSASAVIAGRQLRRTAQINMFRELLPALMPARSKWLLDEPQQGQGYGPREYIRVFDSLWRESVVAGIEERAMVEELGVFDRQRQDVISSGQWTQDEVGDSYWTVDDSELIRLDKAYSDCLKRLDNLLARRLGGRRAVG